MRRRITGQQGITLAEVLIAVAIIGVGLVALSAAIPIAAYGIQEGSQLSNATFLANQRLEQVRNALWQSGAPCTDGLGVSAKATTAPASTCGGATTFADENPMAAPYAGYSRTVRVTDCGVGAGCAGVVNAGLRQISVAVSYRPMTGIGPAAAGTLKTATVTMYIAQR